jgi:hypothetical protein
MPFSDQRPRRPGQSLKRGPRTLLAEDYIRWQEYPQ